MLKVLFSSGVYNYLSKCSPVRHLSATTLKLIKEGGATIQIPIQTSEKQESQSVFYNPVQEFNRDLSVLVLREYVHSVLAQKKPNTEITILEPLAASGLRTIRFMKEVPEIQHAVANDLEKEAVNMMNDNLKINDLTSKVEGIHLLSPSRRR